MSVAPTRAVVGVASAEVTPAAQCALGPALAGTLWTSCEAAACGLNRGEFKEVLLGIGMAQNFGLAEGLAAKASEAQQAAFFAGVHLSELVLARACAAGKEQAWERFIALYRAPLLRAAVAITGQESLGRELADGLYAELYGLTEREGERRCPLNGYSGRGSLMGWLRTTLAQRQVDHLRRTRREAPLEENGSCDPGVPDRQSGEGESISLAMLSGAVREAFAAQPEEDRLLLASYFLDGRTLQAIAAVLGVHEATVSRRLKRVTEAVRKRLMRNLQGRGLSRREAEEALATDPRDLSGSGWLEWPRVGSEGSKDERERRRWKELLQASPRGTFKEQAEP